MIEAKASLGFSPSTAIEDITEEKMQIKFGEKLVMVSFYSVCHSVTLSQLHTVKSVLINFIHFSHDSILKTLKSIR